MFSESLPDPISALSSEQTNMRSASVGLVSRWLLRLGWGEGLAVLFASSAALVMVR